MLVKLSNIDYYMFVIAIYKTMSDLGSRLSLLLKGNHHLYSLR